LSFKVTTAGLSAGSYSCTVTASAPGFNVATLHISLQVTAASPPKSILFSKSSESTTLSQEATTSILSYISTSDNVPVTVSLTATDSTGAVPSWLTINGRVLNGINYTAGSEISFGLASANRAPATYSATIRASSTDKLSRLFNDTAGWLAT
jgi:hypothetical protein